MDKNKLLKMITSVHLCMMAHPDNIPDSEFADRISDLDKVYFDLKKEKDLVESEKLNDYCKTQIENLEKWDRSKTLSEYGMGRLVTYKELTEYIGNSMDWIDFKKTKPKENQIVWAITEGYRGALMLKYIYVEDGDNSGWAFATLYHVPYYNNGQWQGEADYDDNYTVTHYQPLPEPLVV